MRLLEAATLLKADHCDGAKYLCGFSIEHALKLQICKTLNWDNYPPLKPGASVDKEDFDPHLKSFKIHDLQALLLLSGKFKELTNNGNLSASWDTLKTSWSSEIRYQISNKTKKQLRQETKDMIEAAKSILTFLKIKVNIKI